MSAQRNVLTGNEAIARGAYEAGVGVATAYPGTPSTEIMEHLVSLGSPAHCEWSVNEKVALEVAKGASTVGVRSLAVMKHVGLNVAADALMNAAYVGTEGGLVVAVADDPGMHSSQNEQDSRHYARFAKLPLLEPSDSQEAKDFTKYAFTLSEKFHTPVILRSTTRISHCSSPVLLASPEGTRPAPRFVKDPERLVPVPAFAREMRWALEARLQKLRAFATSCPLNRVVRSVGEPAIITGSIAFQYVMEEFPHAAVLKLGLPYPFPDELIRRFAREHAAVLVVEELDDIMEEHVRSLGIKVAGRKYFPGIGELTPEKTHQAHQEMVSSRRGKPNQPLRLPARPPVFCPGCPHRALFHVLSKIDCTVTGDIGCYSLGVLPPYERLDTILCMGAGVTMAHGMERAGYREKPVVGLIGDSTFFHSGVTGLLDLAYNKGHATIIVLDNRITAMTGHQHHPGTGRTASGDTTTMAQPEAFARACGIERIRVVDPLRIPETTAILAEEVAREEPSLIVSRRACALLDKEMAEKCHIDADVCTGCQRCVHLGCPAIQVREGQKRPHIDAALCRGCELCLQICPQEAIRISSS